MSKLDYIRKMYLGGGAALPGQEEKKKKKKKKRVNGVAVANVMNVHIKDADEVVFSDQEDQTDDEERPTIANLDEFEGQHEELAKVAKLQPGTTLAKGKSPPRRRRHDSDNDASPPRRRRHDSDNDASPPRRRRHDSDNDASPPRRRRHDSDNDASPPRRRRHDSDDDMSSKKRGRSQEAEDPAKKMKTDPGKDSKGRLKTMESGHEAGLRSSKQVRQDIDKQKAKMESQFGKAEASALGKGAGTVYRDRRGRKLEMLNEFMRQEDGVVRDREMENMEWGKGHVQREQEKAMAQRLEDAKDMPFSRYADDENLNDHLKEKDRWGDPMANLVSKKKSKGKAKVKRPEYKGFAPPNRFNIRPGHRWDGVDRSNGFEKKFYERQNEKQAREREAYLWSVEDM